MKMKEISKIIGEDYLDSINSRLKLLSLTNMEFGNEGDENETPNKRQLSLFYDITPRNKEYAKFYQNVDNTVLEINYDIKNEFVMKIEYPYIEDYLKYIDDKNIFESMVTDTIRISPEAFNVFGKLVSELIHDINILNSVRFKKFVKNSFDKICKDFYGEYETNKR